MKTAKILALLEAETGPLWTHFRTKAFNDRFEPLPKTIKKRAKVVFQQMVSDPSRTDLSPIHQVKGVYRITVLDATPGYRAAARRVGTNLYWYFIGTHREYERHVLGAR